MAQLQGYLSDTAVTQKLAQRRFATGKRTLDQPRQLTNWRLWRALAEEVNAGLKACFPAQERFNDDAIKSLSERPRQRQLQALPMDILVLIQQSRPLVTLVGNQ